MKWVRDFNSHRQERINESLIGKLFGKLTDKLSLGYSKMFGTAKEVEELFKKYENEVLVRQEVQNKALSAYAEYVALVKTSGEKDENKLKLLTENIEKAKGKFKEEVTLLKQKFDVEFKGVTSKEDNPKIKNYIELKKIEMQLNLLNKETESLLGDGKLTEEDVENDPILKSIQERGNVLKENMKKTKEILDSEEKSTGFDLDRAKELADKETPEVYVWEDSPYTKDDYKFEKGDEIMYFSMSNCKDAQDKKSYIGNKATVVEDIGEGKIKIDTESTTGVEIKKTAVIKAPNKKEEEQEVTAEEETTTV